jgi:hypothetical protein
MVDVVELQHIVNERDARIAALEAEVARLRPPPPPPPTIDGEFRVPSTPDVARLCDIALTRYPRLRPKAVDHEKFLRCVRTCMQFLGTVCRLPKGKLDDRYRERWRDRCEQWVNAEGLAADVSVGTFLISVVCCGDVDYRDPNSLGNGGTLCFGLADSGTGRRAKNLWLLTLQTGRVREPLPAPLYGDWRPGVRRLPSGNERFWVPGQYDV